MSKKTLCFTALLLLCSNAQAYIWSTAVPTAVHLVQEGLVLVGLFNNEGVTCATGPQAIFLPASDPNFKSKLSVALTAFATGKRIQVLINDPLATNCVQISGHGWVPLAYPNYWLMVQ